MANFLLGVLLTWLSFSVLALWGTLNNTRRALSKLMALTEEKWRAEAMVAQRQIDAIIEDTIEQLRRDSDDLD
jgi:hypothetical protein